MGYSPVALSRRRFMLGAGVSGAALLAGCGRLPWQRSETARVPRIGFLSLYPRDPAADEAFRQYLREWGYVDGQTIAMEYRSAEGQEERYPDLAAELVGLPVDVIVAQGLAVAQAAKAATSTVPVVFTGVSDPVGTGLVASLAQPGGNLTGLSAFATELSGKRLQLLRDTLPAISRVAVLAAPTTSPTQVRETEIAARALGLPLQLLEIGSSEDLELAFEAAAAARAEALVVLLGAPLVAAAEAIAELAIAWHLPSIAPDRRFTEAGSLMSYGPNLSDMWRRVAYYVDRILKGTPPSELPVEQPMTFDFVVNLKTARELGITFPREILLQVTEVID